MNRSTPGLPVHHHLPEFTLTHVHRVGDAIQPSHLLSSPFPPAPNPSQHQSFWFWRTRANKPHHISWHYFQGTGQLSTWWIPAWSNHGQLKHQPALITIEIRPLKINVAVFSLEGMRQLGFDTGSCSHTVPQSDNAGQGLASFQGPWPVKNMDEDFPGGPAVRIHLPMQGTWVQSLVWEDPICHGATKPLCHNYWSPHAWSLCSTPREVYCNDNPALQWRIIPLTITRENPHTKTQCNQK